MLFITVFLSFVLSAFAGTSIIILMTDYPEETTGQWPSVLAAAKQYPEQHFTLVIYFPSYPQKVLSNGTFPIQGSDYWKPISEFNSLPNVRTLAYTHVAKGTRDIFKVQREVNAYATWYRYKEADIAMRGIYVDQAPSTIDKLPYMMKVHSYIKFRFSHFHVNARIITNPGTIVPKEFYNYADTIIALEAEAKHLYDPDTLFTSHNSSLSYGQNPEKQGAWIYVYTDTVAAMDRLVRKLVRLRKVGELFITDAYYFSATDAFMDSFFASVNKWNKSLK